MFIKSKRVVPKQMVRKFSKLINVVQTNKNVKKNIFNRFFIQNLFHLLKKNYQVAKFHHK